MRSLREHEKRLIGCLLKDIQKHSFDIENQQVVDMTDGSMGSIYFIRGDKPESERKMKERIAEEQFKDSDGIPILVSLNTDDDGFLLELDIWKVDFSPLITYPIC
jgi:hypothetical protein